MKRANAVVLFGLVLLLTAGALAMPPAPGVDIDLRAWAEERARLGIDVSKNPVRDAGADGWVNSPGDVSILVSGTKRFVAVTIQYPDQLLTYAASSFASMLFGTWASGSARDFYLAQSYGRFNMTGIVLGWYTSINNRAYYGYASGSQRAAMLAKEAAQRADSSVNYALYDNDGDGWVDVFTCIHSGYGREESGSGLDIHSHSWNFISAGIGAYTTNDPDPVNGGYIRISEYVVDPERSNYSNNGTMVGIGVFCHEWGHALGLPDLYDVYGTGEGVGNWSLMSGGSWGTNGNSPWFPSSMTAWEKMELGWLNPRAVRSRSRHTLAAVESLPEALWLISRNRSFKEYWLVENRFKMRNDTNMFASGLHIWHVDDSIVRARRSSNRMNSNDGGWRYGVAMEQADGLDELYSGADRGDANDPWPGGLGRVTFDSSTTPNSRTNGGGALMSGAWVKNISAAGRSMTCSTSSGVTGAFTGGPDGFGYTWIDSDTAGGPAFNFVDIASTGLRLGVGDEARWRLPLPFTFRFYGTNYDTCWVSTNGWLSFGADPGTNAATNTALPAAAAPNAAVYAYWDDLNLVASDSAGVYQQTFGSSPNRYTVISWVDARVVGSPSYKGYYNQVTFQVVMYEDGRLIVQHKDAACSDTTRNWGHSATVGIENAAGTVGLQYLYNGAPVGNLINNVRAVSFGTNVDVAVTAILAPAGIVDSGTPVTPQARVQNNSSFAVSFPVTMTITGGYANTQNVTSLGAGASTVVSFSGWNAAPRGVLAVRCTTAASGDNIRANDTLSGSVTVRVVDATTMRIVQPPSSVDSGSVVPVTAWVRNSGNVAATFNALATISGTAYSSSRGVIGLASGDSSLLTFDPWTAVEMGAHTVACTTQLAGDLNRANDKATKNVAVSVIDAAALRITAPSGTVDSGAIVTPRAWVRNLGTAAATFPVLLRIGAWTNTQNVTALAPGDSVQVSFVNWAATARGTFVTACTTQLAGDAISANNKATGSVTVRVLDAQAVRIVAPSGLLDSGNVVTPQAWVRNRGSAAATFPVTFRVGAFYTSTQNATALASGDSILLSFAAWNVTQRGTHAMRCTTQLAGDAIGANNYVDGAITVRLTDVAARAVIAPAGALDSGAVVTPQARVRNNGTAAATFTATMRIGGTYVNTQNVTSLAAGDSTIVNFANWTASPRGTFATRCSVYLAGDNVPANDVVTGSVTVSVVDAGILRIAAPSGAVDSGALITPQSWVRNWGTAPANFNATLRVGGTYTNTQAVTNLPAGDSALVNFASWTARPRGALAVRCSLYLAGDTRRANDTLSGSVTVRVVDAAALRVVAPSGLVDTGALITPQAWVRNPGTQTASFSASLAIVGTGYGNIQTVTGLAAGDSSLISFAGWTAGPRGVHAVRCSVTLSGDLNPNNNLATGTVNVRALDVGVTAILAPADSVDSGSVLSPQARVKNFGSGTVSFPVTFRIGTGYSSVQNVTNLASGDSTTLTFANWTAAQRGTYAVVCTTALTGDAYPFNSWRSGAVTVRVRDAVLARIVAPAGNADSGQPIQPRSVVRNAGTQPASFPVTFRITPGYTNTQNVTALAPGDSATVTFASWTPLTDTYDLEVFTALSGDLLPQNDTARARVVAAPRPDFGVLAIVEPSGIYDAGAVIWPSATWRNYGSRNAPFEAWVLISGPGGGRVYSSRVDVSGLAPGADTTLAGFAPCTLAVSGSWLAKCSTWADGDADPANDEQSILFRVERGWTELEPVPLGPSGKYCKDGAWLSPMAGTGLLYGFKGNGVPEFYSFDPVGGYWDSLPSLMPGITTKPPKKGADGVTDGNRYVYAVRGNNTVDYCRYDATGATWERLADVPIGLSGKKVKGGGDFAYVQLGDSGYVYFLKGYNSEFYRYNTGSNTWQALPEPPAGIKGRWNRGSWLVYDGASTLYAHKARYHELYSFDIALGQWSQTNHLTAMPIPGSGGSKKAKDGSSAAWYRDGINAFKGSNTQEFWRYIPAEDRWVETDTLPRYGSSGRARKVKNGGSLAALDGGIYAFKGNRTREFWRYRGTVVAMDGVPPGAARSGVTAAPGRRTMLEGLRVSPNPTGTGAVNLSLGTSAPAVIRLFDAAGRLALERRSPGGKDLVLDTRGLQAGVYLLEVRTATGATTRKLVVDR
ncbi:MAG: M6 family metalloprotease domain-containing protein [bacterium]